MNRTLEQLCRVARDLGVADDGQLLDDFVARRDAAAFAQLVRRHGPMVLAVCRRVLRHQQDAEDAFQATFLVLARKAEDVWPRDAVGGWLHGVAYRVAMKARGVRAKLARREYPLEDVARDAPEPACPDLADVLDRAIRKLPEVYRAAVVACDLEGRTRKDAAEQLGWKEGTLSGRLARARQLLAARLKKAGLAVAAGGAIPTATAEGLPSELANRAIELAASRAGVSAPIAALTEGVVWGMALVKIKTTAALVFAVSVMGLGVWSASGQGPGDGGQPAKAVGERPRVSGPSTPTDLERLQGEWIIGWRYFRDDPPSEVVAAAVSAAKKEGTLLVVDGNQMTWPLVESTQHEVGGDWKRTMTSRSLTIKLDPTQSPKHIDLTDEKGNVTKGIYKFIEQTGDFMFVLETKGGRPKGFEADRIQDIEPWWNLWQPRPSTRRTPPKPGTGPGIDIKSASERRELVMQELQLMVVQHAARPQVMDPRQFECQLERDKANLAALLRKLDEAEAELKAEKARRAPPKQPQTASYTLHIRTPLAQEQMEWQQLAGSETVLDAVKRSDAAAKLVHQNVSAWIVRDGKMLSVDLPAIVADGETRTNYQICNGDKLFIQVNVRK